MFTIDDVTVAIVFNTMAKRIDPIIEYLATGHVPTDSDLQRIPLTDQEVMPTHDRINILDFKRAVVNFDFV